LRFAECRSEIGVKTARISFNAAKGTAGLSAGDSRAHAHAHQLILCKAREYRRAITR
jgi:hypothetical protein